MSSCKHVQIGAIGEDIATAYLMSLGYQILDRNWRVADTNKERKHMVRGEIDVIALRPEGDLVFCEVKTRTSKKYGDPLEAINKSKLHRITQLALAWQILHGCWGDPYEIDAIGIIMESENQYRIDHRVSVAQS
jgi:putative endonuclease